MNIGLMNRDGHWDAKCVNHNAFLASFDFLVPVNALAGSSSILGGLHASRVYDSHVGLTFLPMILRARECGESMISSNVPSSFHFRK